MLRKWTCAILGGLLLVCSLGALVGAEEELYYYGENLDKSLDRGIELSELAYEDHCVPVAQAAWKFLHWPNDPTALEEWVSI